ncbi:MAG: hydroxymethylbilane synthase [Halobacteriovorax sp.]|nr:hydroxymethylbilane synthase [Halobacteriovorax sp.]|tara:strand:+ start:144251 stop:145705 length:1455 start_codon:yes stop_codon:yes gene_type:complete
MLIKIASRKSDLARLQAYIVAEELKEAFHEVNIEHLFSASFGDLNPDIPLDQMPTKGAFTEDFKEGIKNREFDLVVHSWKDLPTDLPKDSLLFTLKREDPRDLLIIRKDSIQKRDLKVLTSSPRRIHHIEPFIKSYFPHKIDTVECPEVRGNIPTRLKKLIQKEGDALIMAKAALDRLLTAKKEEFAEVKKELREYLDLCQFMVLPLAEFPTAAAQGALAIEVHKDNHEIIALLEKIHCPQTFKNVKRERELLKSFGGGCHQKLGMTSIPHECGDYFSVSGETPSREAIKSLELIGQKNNSSLKISRDEIFEDPKFFKRKKIEVDIRESDLYIAKDYALPDNFTQGEKLIATSGLSSWKKLAAKGLWVTCSSESLGEEYGRNIEVLLNRSIKWTKLSHSHAPGKKIATYELVPLKEQPDLSGKKYFYWMSGSQFELALSNNPELTKAFHACGPGNTRSTILKYIPSENLEIYLSYDQWYQSKIG